VRNVIRPKTTEEVRKKVVSAGDSQRGANEGKTVTSTKAGFAVKHLDTAGGGIKSGGGGGLSCNEKIVTLGPFQKGPVFPPEKLGPGVPEELH